MKSAFTPLYIVYVLTSWRYALHDSNNTGNVERTILYSFGGSIYYLGVGDVVDVELYTLAASAIYNNCNVHE